MMQVKLKRGWIIVAVGILLIGGALFYNNFILARPIGSGPAGPVVDRKAFAMKWTEKEVRLIGIGDSITAGLGAKTPDHSFFNRLIKNPGDEFPEMVGLSLTAVLPNLQFENFAISGSTSLDHIGVLEDRLIKQPASVFGLVVMTSGGNDLIHSYGRLPPREGAMYGATLVEAEPWIEAYGLRLLRMFETIEDRFPGGCEIYIGDIYDPTDGVGDGESLSLPSWKDGLAIHDRYNRMIRECAKLHSNVHVVPLHKTFLGHGSHCRQFWRKTYDRNDPHFWFYQNIEDPNDRGYDAIRRAFLNAILEHSSLKPSASTSQ